MRINTPLLVVVVALSIALSYYLHNPMVSAPLVGLKYSDVVYGVFSTRFNPGDPSLWFNTGKLEELKSGRRLCPIPYVDYKFEYPPLIALLFLISTCTGFMLVLPQSYPPSEYSLLIERVTQVHYNIQALALITAFLVTVVLVVVLSREFNLESWRYILLPILPSTIVYTIYNWDIISSAFLLAGVLFYLRRRYMLAGVLTGLSISTKLLTFLAGIALAVRLVALGEREGFKSYITAFLAFSIIPYAVVYLVTPQGFLAFVNHHSRWYCENCIYMILEGDIWSPLHRVAATLVIGLTSIIVLFLSTRRDVRVDQLLLLATSTPIIFNYVFTPQMILLITPIAILTLSNRSLALYSLADILNALIIISFFEELLARGNPWTLEGVTQKIAMARNLVLLILWVHLVFKIMKSSRVLSE